MPNVLTRAVLDEYEGLLGERDDALFVQPVGMSVGEVNAFRVRLADSGLRMQLLRGRLAMRVLEARGLTGAESIFAGPAAVIVPTGESSSGDAAVSAAKLVAQWRKEAKTELPALKGGLVDGTVLDAQSAARLESMPGRAELFSRISGQLLAPGARLASQILAPGRAVAGAVKAHADAQAGPEA